MEVIMKAIIELPDPLRRVLPFGTRVVCVTVDMNGHQGREHHPEWKDRGFIGVIVHNYVENHEKNQIEKDVAPYSIVHRDATLYYTVVSPLGKRLQLLDFEIEVLP